MSSSAKRWFFSTDDSTSGAVRVQYEDGSPLVNSVTKSPFGIVYNTQVPFATEFEVPSHAIDVSILYYNGTN